MAARREAQATQTRRQPQTRRRLRKEAARGVAPGREGSREETRGQPQTRRRIREKAPR